MVTAHDSVEHEERADGSVDERIPCPAPACDGVPSASDRYCEVYGTWLGLDGEEPPTTGPLGRALLSTGALKIVTMIERAEASLNDMCK
jgi:hypothetical protein